MTTPYLKGAANTHVAFLQKHSTLNLQWWKLRLKHHTCYVLHYFKLSSLLADILADIFLNMFLTSLPRHSLWISFRHIFWHSWHIFDHSFWRVFFWTSCRHIFWHSFWLILWHLATTSLTYSFYKYYQSFRSPLRSDTPRNTAICSTFAPFRNEWRCRGGQTSNPGRK